MAARRTFARLIALGSLIATTHAVAAPFRFDRDTFAFHNATVLEYENGRPVFRLRSTTKNSDNAYAHSCFVMSRSALQFHKFARFDPRGAPLDNKQIAVRIREVVRRAPWRSALPDRERIVFPGYSDLRAISNAHRSVFQAKLGSGFSTYFRPGNFRMFFQHSRKYQETTHAHLEAALAHGDMFVGYLSTYPDLTLNHAVLVYARRQANDGLEHYLVYDPNHAEAPRELTWSSRGREFAFQKDIDFIGGFVRVYQVYGKWLQ